MRGYLRYVGAFPRHALKMDWEDGTAVSLSDLFKQFPCPVADRLDDKFVAWFKEAYANKLGPDFELVVDADTPAAPQKVFVDATVEVAHSQEDATSRLRNLRHVEEVGHIESEIPNMMPAPRDKRAEIKAVETSAEHVMTGDDLERLTETSADNARHRGTVFTMNELAETISVVPSSKDERDRVNRQLAEVSRGAKILSEEFIANGDYSAPATSRVLVGGSNNAETAEVSHKVQSEAGSTRRNKNFQGHATAHSKPDVTVEDIVSAPSKEDAFKLIGACKNQSVLKIVKSYYRDIGNQPLVEVVERRLGTLPPFSM
jgi:hypothetical protein